MPKLEIGKRYLFKPHVSDPYVQEGDVRKFSPNGEYVNMGCGRWCSVNDMVVLDTLPEDEADLIPFAPQQQQQQQPPSPPPPNPAEPVQTSGTENPPTDPPVATN